MAKMYGCEFRQRLSVFGVRLLGLYGQLGPGSKWAPLHGQLAKYYLTAVYFTISGGSSEVNRNIIATRGLGLPRGSS